MSVRPRSTVRWKRQPLLSAKRRDNKADWRGTGMSTAGTNLSGNPTNRALGWDDPNNYGQSKTVSLGLGRLLQLGVFRFGFFQDGNIGISVFPQCEEIFVGGAGFRRVAL
jgi:hypothetical protein